MQFPSKHDNDVDAADDEDHDNYVYYDDDDGEDYLLHPVQLLKNNLRLTHRVKDFGPHTEIQTRFSETTYAHSELYASIYGT